MDLVAMVHPTLEGRHEVPESAVGHWARVGWRRADEPEEQPADPAVQVQVAAPEPPQDDPAPNRRRRMTTSKEGE